MYVKYFEHYLAIASTQQILSVFIIMTPRLFPLTKLIEPQLKTPPCLRVLLSH